MVKISAFSPMEPFSGIKAETFGISDATKLVALIPVPILFVTLMGPETTPAGTLARICVSESTVKLVEETPLNETLLASEKLVPLIVTCVPPKPPAGANDVMAGGANKSKLLALMAVPAGLDTLMGPEEPPLGAIALSSLSESTVKPTAATPLKLTFVTSTKLVPVMVTSVASGPAGGLKAVIVGVTEVTFNGTPVNSFEFDSDSRIRAQAPFGAYDRSEVWRAGCR